MEVPFKQATAVEIQLCVVGITCAYGKWIEEHGTFPLIVWVHPSKIAYADKILDMMPTRLMALPDESYQEDWWSVGSRSDKGFGSILS